MFMWYAVVYSLSNRNWLHAPVSGLFILLEKYPVKFQAQLGKFDSRNYIRFGNYSACLTKYYEVCKSTQQREIV